MEEFPANSQKARARTEPKKIERVTSAEAVRRQRGLGRKFKDTFIGGDARTAFSYMVTDVMIPAVQDTMIDAFQGGIERLIRGEGPRHRNRSPRGYGGYGSTPYVNYQERSAPQSRPSPPRML